MTPSHFLIFMLLALSCTDGFTPIRWRKVRHPSQWRQAALGVSRKESFSEAFTVSNNSTFVPTLTPPRQSSSEFNPVTSRPHIGDAKKIMFLLLWSMACLSALDRVAMSVALVPMSEELAWADTTKGAISSLFSVGYGLCIIPVGLLVSRGRPTVVLAAGVALWSVATMLTPDAALIPGMLALLVARAVVGAGESVIVPTIQTLLIEWTASEEKSSALSLIYSGFHTGTILAYLISPVIMQQLGWKGLFEVFGAAGLLILVPWVLCAQDRPGANGGVIAETEILRRGLILKPSQREATARVQQAPWKAFLDSPAVWAMLLAHCAKNWGLYTSLAWTPSFFAEQYHLDAGDSALFSVMPSVLGAIGGVIAGNAADMLLLNTSGESVVYRTKLRKAFQSLAFLGPAVSLALLAIQMPDEPWLAQVFLMVSVGLQSVNVAGFEAGTQEKAGSQWAGLLYSLTSLPAVMFGTTGVYITGRILDATGQNWSIVFGLNAAVNVLGAVAFASLYDAKREFD